VAYTVDVEVELQGDCARLVECSETFFGKLRSSRSAFAQVLPTSSAKRQPTSQARLKHSSEHQTLQLDDTVQSPF
jgi:hypothetical protein